MMQNKKIQVAICDDEITIANILKDKLRTLDKDNILEVQIYESGGKLLEKIKEFEVVFLDMEMPEIDGIELGKKLLKRNPQCKIIMETSHVERFKEAFRLGAKRFLSKPFIDEEIEECIQMIQKVELGNQIIEVYKNRELYQISQKDIDYIRAYNGYVYIQVNNTIYRKNCSLSSLFQQLEEKLFVQISREYVVNMAKINDYKRYEVDVVSNNMKISRRLYSQFERAYIDFDLHNRH